MKLPKAMPRRARWAVPAGAVAAVTVAATVSAVTIAQAAPALPHRTPAQLLAAIAGQHAPPPALTGTVVETAQLGIPNLPGQDDPTSIASLLTGSHTIRVWYADPRHFRLSVPVTMRESDLIRNGNTAWLWQSSRDSVTRIELPSRLPGDIRRETRSPLTPQQAARQALAALGPTTRVSTQSNVTVAGRAAYRLVLAPRDSRSLIGRVTIAVDGHHLGVPLRVQVFARGARSPAVSVGYTTISFVRPAAANFAFTPPKGAHVRTLPAPGRWYAYAPLGGQRLVPPMNGWSGVPPAGLRIHGKVVRAMQVRVHNGHVTVMPASMPQLPAMAPQVIGTGWLSVAVLPEGALGGLAANGNAAAVAGQAARSVAGAGGSVGNAAIVGTLLQAGTPVHGRWGSGKLIHTSLISILVMNNGHVLVGAVTPSVLYADAAHVR